MLDRIPKLLKSKNISASQFADEIGVQRSSVSHVLSGRNKPSLDFITKIVNTYPEVNPKWLLTGHGDMFTAETDDNSARSLSNQQTNLEKDEDKLIIAEEKQVHPHSSNKKTGSSKTTTGSESIERIVIFYRNGTYQEYTTGK